jgi:hypothetical protein
MVRIRRGRETGASTGTEYLATLKSLLQVPGRCVSATRGQT